MHPSIKSFLSLLRPRTKGLAGGFMVGLTAAVSQAHALPLETGIWVDDTGAGAVEIYVCSDRADRLCGRIIWLREPLNAQGVPKRDRYNPNADMQNRPICGLPILGNLAQLSGGGFDGGWIYDPKVGKSYDAAIQLTSPDRLVVTGYIGVKFLSKSFTWQRAPVDLVRCPTAPPPAVPEEAKASPPPATAKPSTAKTGAGATSAKTSAGAATTGSTTAKASAGPAIVPPAPKPAVAPKKLTGAPEAAPRQNE